MSKTTLARLQTGLAYVVLGFLLVLVVFPFYWMTITSFKTEDQMRSVVSMFWPSFPVPYVTWLLMGYLESIPVELEEAAMIDGATRFGAFRREREELTPAQPRNDESIQAEPPETFFWGSVGRVRAGWYDQRAESAGRRPGREVLTLSVRRPI